MATKFLFISHDDTLTGAPELLLRLQKALRKQMPDLQIDFLIKKSYGDLLQQFEACGKVFILQEDTSKSLFKRSIAKTLKKYANATVERKIRNLHLNNYSLILSNTITNGDIINYIKKYYRGTIITYVHELEMAYKYFTNSYYTDNVLNTSNLFFVPSDAVKMFLIQQFNIQPEVIKKLPYQINVNNKTDSLKRTKLNDLFIVGGCGTIDWRKGVDIFILVAMKVVRSLGISNIKFMWKGGKYELEYDRLMYDVEKSGLKDNVEIILASSDTYSFYSTIDLFLLTSREDPFPLVVLEAASYKVPSVCFKSAGGAEEFIASDAGAVVSYIDIQDMANTIIDYYNDREKLKNHGTRAYEKVSVGYSEEMVSKCFFSELENIELKIRNA